MRTVFFFSIVSHFALSALTLQLDWFPNPVHIPLFVAVEHRLFEKEGIDLSIECSSDPYHAFQAVRSGFSDISLYYTPQFIAKQTTFSDLELICSYIQAPMQGAFFRRTDKNQHPLFVSSGKVSQRLALAIHPYITVSAEQGSFQYALGVVDSFYGGYEPIEGEVFCSLNIDHYFTSLTEVAVPPFPEHVFIAKKTLIQKHPNFSLKFQKALQASFAFCITHPDEAFDLYANKIRTKSRKTLEREKRSWKKIIPLLSNSPLPLEPLRKWLLIGEDGEAHQQ